MNCERRDCNDKGKRYCQDRISNTQLLDINQVRSLLNCSQRHIYRLVEKDQMPKPIKLGSIVRWSSSVIDNWIFNDCPPVSSLDRKNSHSKKAGK